MAKKIQEFSKMEIPEQKKKKFKKDCNLLLKYLEKILDYESKEEICGPNRNSFYKTDYDATAMCLKDDYYAGLGSSMHAAYTTQITVSII